MRILCDMGVSTKVVDWLRDQGHDSVHLRDEGLHRLVIEESRLRIREWPINEVD